TGRPHRAVIRRRDATERRRRDVNGWRGTGSGGLQDASPLELIVLCVLGAAAVVALPVWMGAQLAALAHTGHSLPPALSDAARGERRTARGGAPGLYLGRDVRSRQRLFGAAEDSYLYLGPPRSGKGVHLIIPQTIEAPGSALVTATRPDTLHHTLALRADRGPVAVFDPQDLAGERVPRLRWAPQRGCDDALTAIARARALAAG